MNLKTNIFWNLLRPDMKSSYCLNGKTRKKVFISLMKLKQQSKEGRKHNLLITTSPVIGTNHYILVQRDITEFKNLEKKLYDSQKLAAFGQLSAGHSS